MSIPDGLLSRADLARAVDISDEVIAFWARSGLIQSQKRSERVHRRFDERELRIALLLRVARDHGLNSQALAAIVESIRRGFEVYDAKLQAVYLDEILYSLRQPEYDEAILALNFFKGASILVVFQDEEGNWQTMNSIADVDQLPAPFAFVFDLSRILSSAAVSEAIARMARARASAPKQTSVHGESDDYVVRRVLEDLAEGLFPNRSQAIDHYLVAVEGDSDDAKRRRLFRKVRIALREEKGCR